MQCPEHVKLRTEMYAHLKMCDYKIDQLIMEKPHEIFNWLIGKEIVWLDINTMYDFWTISSKYICNMYHQVCRSRTGIG